MRKIVNSRSVLAFAMLFGLSAVGVAQDQNTNSNNNTSTQSTTQNSSTTTSSSTDTTGTDQGAQTDTTSHQTRTNRTDQTTTGTDINGNATTTRTTTQDSATRTTRNRTMDTDKSMVGDRDRRFLTKAAEGGLMEVQLAQMAQRQASSQAVKDFARQLEQDHTNANKQLMDIATQRNVSLPTTPMASDHQQAIDRLGKLSGADFDRQYIRIMVRDHRKDIKEFESESNNGMDTSLKSFASSTLPALRNHLQMAEQIDRGGTVTNNATSTTTTSVSESSRSRGKGSTVVEEDKSTINKVTPAPASVTTTEVDRTTTNSDGSVREDKTTVNKVTSKP